MSDIETYDGAGVLVTRLRNGKYKAERIAVKDGRVIVLHQITTDRTLMWAHENATNDFRGLVTSINRGSVPLSAGEAISIKVDE